MKQSIQIAVFASFKQNPELQTLLSGFGDPPDSRQAGICFHLFDSIADLYFHLFGQIDHKTDAVLLDRQCNPKQADQLAICVANHFPHLKLMILSDELDLQLPNATRISPGDFGYERLHTLLLHLQEDRPVTKSSAPWRQSGPNQQNLEWLSNRYQLLLDGAGEGILGLDRHGTITFANPLASTLLGAELDQLIGRPFSDFSLDSPLNKGSSPESFTRDQAARRRVGRGLITRPDNQLLYVEYTLSFVGENDDDTVSVMVIEDISERIKFEAKLKRLAHTDALTQLHNRLYFEKSLQRELNNRRAGEARLVLALVDLDGFKQVNDTYGHPAGDQLLMMAAKRLRDQVRRGDLVARLGGDEFTILIKNSDLDQARQLAEKILFHLHEPFVIDGHTLRISASIGICRVDERMGSLKECLEKADMAMYSVKNSGKNGVALYE